MLLSVLIHLLPLAAAAAVPGQPPAQSDGTERFLAKFGPNEAPIWIGVDDIAKYKAEGKNFFEVSQWANEPDVQVVAVSAPVFPTPGAKADVLKPLLPKLDLDWSKEFLLGLTVNDSRYYNDVSGWSASKWLLNKAQEVTAPFPGAKATPFKHSFGWQDSIIVRLPHTGPADAPLTIVGAHFDTTRLVNSGQHAQDDNGSGVTSAMDALRVLSNAKYTPTNPIEFHFYGMEEIGSVGSAEIAKKYKKDGVKVAGMFNLDMTAWVKKGTTPVAAVVQDYVNMDLTHFVEGLSDQYLAIPKAKTACGYACTDHASWTQAGFPAAYAQESLQENLNPHADTYLDTVNHPEFQWEHLREFSKLALVFAGELSA